MFVTGIIAAGGRGTRVGADRPKQLLAIDGVTLLEHSARLLLTHPRVDALVVALPADVAEAPPAFLADAAKPVRIVVGGARRQDSVRRAFEAVDPRTTLVVVHDAARPCASAALVTTTIEAAAQTGAALAALPARDTVKQAQPAPARGAAPSHAATGGATLVARTVPRALVHLAQTPQAFQRRVLADAFAADDAAAAQGATAEATDEAELVERAGYPVQLVVGEARNLKVTVPEDLVMATTLLRGGDAAPALRVGTGYDLHRLVEGRPLILGGVTIPSERGALGHSDADVVCHAVTDALLGAAACGDIGRLFPDTDPAWKDANSVLLLARAVEVIREAGCQPVNVDVTVVLERPKVRDHVAAMRAVLAGAIGIEVAAVSIKGKTNEGVDAVGRGEAVAAHAVALVRGR